MAPKRASEDEPQLMNKIQRIEHHGIPTSPQPRHSSNDFSGSVKRRLADSKRTGQACDRCKVRKIRCDGRPEGCTPCEQNRTPCRTTDRITGRATTRGQVEAMEAETNHLRAQIADLRAQLKENGIEPRPTPAYNGMLPLSSPYAPNAQTSDSQSWTDQRRTSSPLAGYAGAVDKPEYRQLPQFKNKSIGDNYLGVGATDARLSHIRGTSLSIFGTDINITDYMQGDVEYEKSIMSYSRLLDVALGTEHVDPVPLPPYQALTEYATWYLRSLNPYTMLVHKPAFMELITKIGTEPDFRPTPAQTVNVHMMLATIQYQIASRNSQSSGLLEESHKHYAYSLSLYKQLLQGRHTIHDIQALTMICHHLRNFPKPGAAWIMTSITYLYAIELGLHRSVRNWKDGEYKISKHDIEMRKRVFWTLNALMVNLTGKLGRPMPISNDDIDVEFPEPINDCLPGEDANLDEFHQCSFQVGIQIAKYTVWEVDLYKLIYSVRASSSTYLERMKLLEAGIKRWKEELPPELRDPSTASADNHIFALYLEYWYQSFFLHLHHPAVCRSTDPAVQNSNLDRCLEASQKMLQNCKDLMLKKSLDIPWINTVVYIAAIFTTLYIQSLRYVQLTPADMTKLKADMATWITVIAECDHFLGSENRLKTAIAKIVEQSLSNINSSIVKRTASESLARVALQNPHQSNTSPQVYPDPGMYRTQYPTGGSSQPETSITPHAPSYSNLSGTPYNLGDPVSIPQQTSTMFNEPIYSTRDDPGMVSTHAAALAVASSNPTPANETYAYAQVPNSVQHAYASHSFTANDWRQWGRTYVQPQSQQMGQPGEYLNTATTLMALGGRDGANPNPGNEVAGSMAGPGVQGHVGHAHWPEMAYPGAANGHMS